MFPSKKDKKPSQINNLKAFTLVELAIVLTIIGILAAGLMNSAGLINSARLAAARSLVADSPVPKISDLFIWLESSGKNAFAIGSGSNFANIVMPSDGQAIGVWNNINPQISPALRENLAQTTAVSQPTFITNAINSLPAIRFSGLQFLQNNKLLLNRAGLSIFIVARRAAVVVNSSILNGRNATNNSFTDSNSTDSLVAFLENNGTNLGSQRNGITLSVSTNRPANNVPFIAATIFNGSANIFYLNGIASTAVSSAQSFFIHQLMLGCRIDASGAAQTCYKGDLAEVIIYKRGLNSAEIDLVEAYLSKKYKIKIS